MVSEALVSLKLYAHINPIQVTAFSSFFAHPLQSAIVLPHTHNVHFTVIQ